VNNTVTTLPPERKTVVMFVECPHCGERWKALTAELPMKLDDFINRMQPAADKFCPNCGRTGCVICPTDGPNKVTEARNGGAPFPPPPPPPSDRR
jgi:hypothetical protein